MNKLYIPLKLISALLAIALLLACVPALAVGSFEAVVSADSMKVYAQKSPHKLLGSLPRGTVVTVTAWSGKAALITCNGKSGVARVSDLSRTNGGATGSGAEASAQGQSIVANRDTRVYRRPSTKSPFATVKAGTTLQLLGVRGSCAKVSLNGKVGYAVYSHLGGSVTTPAATETPSLADEAAVKTGSLPVVTTEKTQVYANADYTGSAVAVEKGTKLTMLALRGDCAMVERDGAIGYVHAAALRKGSDAKKEDDSRLKANPFSADSSEYTIYNFLTGEMKLNRAAAMGVMANMYFESGYKTVINGDSGTSYGLCQWHAGRKTNLINWCNDNNLDYNSLEGQLNFLKYELASRYTSVDKYIRQVENTADGAYDAAYYFCFNFEAPAARTSQSTKRGNYAKNTLWPKK